MYYVKANEGSVVKFPYSIDDLKNDNPNTSFPVDMPAATLADWGVYPVEVSPKPDVAPDQDAVINTLPDYVNGAWVLGWTVQQKTEQEIAQLADEVRAERNAKLTACDWTQLDDAPVSIDRKRIWQEYRQELRGVTSQAGFPTNVTWPESP